MNINLKIEAPENPSREEDLFFKRLVRIFREVCQPLVYKTRSNRTFREIEARITSELKNNVTEDFLLCEIYSSAGQLLTFDNFCIRIEDTLTLSDNRNYYKLWVLESFLL